MLAKFFEQSTSEPVAGVVRRIGYSKGVSLLLDDHTRYFCSGHHWLPDWGPATLPGDVVQFDARISRSRDVPPQTYFNGFRNLTLERACGVCSESPQEMTGRRPTSISGTVLRALLTPRSNDSIAYVVAILGRSELYWADAAMEPGYAALTASGDSVVFHVIRDGHNQVRIRPGSFQCVEPFEAGSGSPPSAAP